MLLDSTNGDKPLREPKTTPRESRSPRENSKMRRIRTGNPRVMRPHSTIGASIRCPLSGRGALWSTTSNARARYGGTLGSTECSRWQSAAVLIAMVFWSKASPLLVVKVASREFEGPSVSYAGIEPATYSSQSRRSIQMS